jgi:hypothetical protein
VWRAERLAWLDERHAELAAFSMKRGEPLRKLGERLAGLGERLP